MSTLPTIEFQPEHSAVLPNRKLLTTGAQITNMRKDASADRKIKDAAPVNRNGRTTGVWRHYGHRLTLALSGG